MDSLSKGSHDVKRLAGDTVQVRFLQDMGAKGIYRAMNVALAQSTGTWVLFLGHDDRLADPSVLEVASKSIKASSFCFWRQAYYGSVLIDGDAGWAKGGAVYDGKFNFAKLLRRNICHQAIFYRGRYARGRRPPYNPDFRVTADWDYNIRAWTSGGYGYIPLTITVFLGGGTSASMKNDGFTGALALTWTYWKTKRPMLLAMITLVYCRIAAVYPRLRSALNLKT
ncbi:glycosyl transferase family protein [Cyanobium gracile]|uniref:Glycosyl transferase n=1 Tax=Cyanobium gracile (strain ATCC 27147 / PCC 6307) TaxID=292564 RepID=K9P9J3_CYAGP|nr:glycosyl transferase [Cyanobium gracile PCC 6307]